MGENALLRPKPPEVARPPSAPSGVLRKETSPVSRNIGDYVKPGAFVIMQQQLWEALVRSCLPPTGSEEATFGQWAVFLDAPWETCLREGSGGVLLHLRQKGCERSGEQHLEGRRS